MKNRFNLTLLFLFACSFFIHAQSENKNLDEKGHRIKTTWTGNGFFHAGLRPGNWELDQFTADHVNINGKDTVFRTGLHGSPTPVYLSVEQMGRFLYWNMDLSLSGNHKSKFTNEDSYFSDYNQQELKGRAVTASFMIAGGYLIKGRFGLFVGGRIGYDNTIIAQNSLAFGTYMNQLGGKRAGYNFHLFFPFIRGMMRISIFTDNMKNTDVNLKAKTHEFEINYCIPFTKSKNAGLMLKFNHMGYSTSNYVPAFQSANNNQEITYKRTYFQIGIIIPIFKELAPDACVTCQGRGFTYEKGAPCTVCGGSGSKTCTHCGGQGLIVTDVTTTCTYCNGSGKVNCPACGGMGSKELLKKNQCEVCHGTGKKPK
jgi:hypothetical protein